MAENLCRIGHAKHEDRIRAIDDSKSKKRAIDDSLEDDGEKMLLDLV